MNPAKSYQINTTKAMSEELDGETIIINLETGVYYSMNPAGTAIWNAIESGKAIPVSNQAVLDFLNRLKQDNLITETDIPAAELADDTTFTDPVFEKYTDMQEMLLADPIHDVDAAGWPNLKKEQ